MTPKPSVAIIGGGAAGIMAAHFLNTKAHVRIYDQSKSLGRKFLVAGKGGFNLSHSSIVTDGPHTAYDTRILRLVQEYDVESFRNWLSEIGIETFIGSSRRIFPIKGTKPIQVLKAIMAPLHEDQIFTDHRFIGWKGNRPVIKNRCSESEIIADYYVFALGGASWKKTGSDGLWSSAAEARGLKIRSFEPANCGVHIDFSDGVLTKSGKPLKNIKLSIGNRENKGELMITSYGLEGNALYPLIPEIRKELKSSDKAVLSIDFKPLNTIDQLIKRVKNFGNSLNYRKALNLSDAQMAVLKSTTSKEVYLNPEQFIPYIKSCPVSVTGLRPLEEAISTAGGLCMDQLTYDLSLKSSAEHYFIGEMLDWETHTGGFLIHACYAMARKVASSIIQ